MAKAARGKKSAGKKAGGKKSASKKSASRKSAAKKSQAKTKSRKAAKPAKKPARRKVLAGAAPTPRKPAVKPKPAALGLVEAAGAPVQALAAGSKQGAVINCVNGALDSNQPGWNADGRGDGRKMGGDFHYDVNGMRAFLDVVRACLAPQFTLTIDDGLIAACVADTVADAKFDILKKTT
jgi:hypothetical protein